MYYLKNVNGVYIFLKHFLLSLSKIQPEKYKTYEIPNKIKEISHLRLNV